MNNNLNEKFVAYFALISGIAISAVAMFYSVSGLVAIYPMALIPIIVMGVSIEVGKISMTLWLKQNWNSPWIYKLTMIPAVVILMLITSGGVFGFLSKAHSDQSLVSGEAFSQVQLIDDKISTVKESINTQRENIAAARSALSQLDSQVNARLDRGADEVSAERSVQIRRNQRAERATLNKEIAEAQNEIANLNNQLAQLNAEKAPLGRELRKVEAEVGPVKYIAALIYGDNPDTNLLERAVRWVTLMIVLVLDPVAILLLLASQYSFQQLREKRNLEIVPPTQPIEPINTATTATFTETVLTTSTADVVAPTMLVDEPVVIRDPIKALPIEEPIEVLEKIEQDTVSEEFVESPTDKYTADPQFDVVNLEIEDTVDIKEIDDKISEPAVEEITIEAEIEKEEVQEVVATADSIITADNNSEVYVQNEEQKTSNLWSSTSIHSISQDQYLEKVRRLKGLSQ